MRTLSIVSRGGNVLAYDLLVGRWIKRQLSAALLRRALFKSSEYESIVSSIIHCFGLVRPSMAFRAPSRVRNLFTNQDLLNMVNNDEEAIISNRIVKWLIFK